MLRQRRCVSQTEQAYSQGRNPSPRPRTLTYGNTAIHSPGLQRRRSWGARAPPIFVVGGPYYTYGAFQLQMFVNKLQDQDNVFRDIMVPEVRSLFVDVEQPIRLMLLCPVSSCAAERSFSALRRLKNWLRSTL